MSIKLIICTDIFGATQALRELALAYKALAIDVKIISPYQAQNSSTPTVMLNNEHIDENLIYEHFLTHCGHTHYQSLITTELLQTFLTQQKTIILSFSAGASACWQALKTLSTEQSTHIQHFIGFYPSQIRHHSDIAPHCPSNLIFPAFEPHFDLTAVINQLGVHKNVHTIQTPWQHGFLNPLSQHFNPRAYQLYQQLLLNLDVLTQPKLFSQHLTTQHSTPIET